MKKAIALAGVTVLLISLSSVFYYKNVDFSNGKNDIKKQEDLSYVELPTFEDVEKEEKKSWFEGLFEKKETPKVEENNIDNEENNSVSQKDISICNENGKIMILMYHKFADIQTDGWTRSFDNFKKDYVRFNAVNSRVNDAYILETQLPMIAYHSRWKELTKDDFLYLGTREKHNVLNGAFVYMLETPVKYSPKNFDEDNAEELSYTELNWIYKIIQLCNENDAELLFTRTPQDSYEVGKYIYFTIFCEENDVAFLWMDYEIDKIGLDFNSDYADGEHANFKGQEKITKYVGQYLKNNYDIPDHRGEADYVYFEDDFDTMMEIVNNYWTKYFI